MMDTIAALATGVLLFALVFRVVNGLWPWQTRRK